MLITPNEKQINLAEALGIQELYFKREDLHPLQSHKGRSIGVMIETYKKEGAAHFAISSSGNAAKAAALYIKNLNEKSADKTRLDIFVGKKINEEKLFSLKELEDQHITLREEERPLQKLFEIIKVGKIKSLRQSTDDLALVGYKELAEELALIPHLSAIFIPTSSGTTAQALGKTFEELGRKIQIHIVQTEFCHPIAEVFDKGTEIRPSIADAIVDKTARRKDRVVEIIKNSKGYGWTVNNREIEEAIALVQKTANISLSPNSALSVAGLKKAINAGWKWEGPIACVITGK